jgi:uncharacterized protein (DUF1800 family)
MTMLDPKTRLLLVLAATLCLPALAAGMTRGEARHLLARTGFGGTAAEIEQLARADYAQAVMGILENTRVQPQTPAPVWVDEPPPDFRKLRGMSEDERRSFRKRRHAQGLELKACWYQEMIHSDSPLTERMTLFWHNHFTSGLRKVKWPTLMYRQNLLLRRHALGNFRELLHAVSTDPAMILYLDNQSNRKGKPNENFAREVMELFTLGEGNYSERDIKEAARAFTGWMVERRSGQFHFNPRRHDPGSKTFMGRTGKFDGDDILDIVLDRRRGAVYITEKLWREFVSDNLDRQEIKRLADIFRTADYEIKPLLQALLMSPSFRAAENHGTLIKSPVDLIVGTVHVLNIPVRDARLLARAGRYLGQDIFDPPNVKGWPGGTAWITSSTLLARQRFLGRIVRAGERPEPSNARDRNALPMIMRAADMEPGFTDVASSRDSRLTTENLQDVLLPVSPVSPVPSTLDLFTLVGYLVLDPVYQLK